MESTGNQAVVKNLQLPQIWLLVEVLNHNANIIKPLVTIPKYFILQLMDLVQSDTQAEGLVKFVHIQCLMEGKVIFSSGYRPIVENKLHELLSKRSLEELIIKMKPKFFLIQFSRSNKEITQAIISHKDIFSPRDIQADQRDIIIFDGRQKLKANLLYICEDEDHIIEELKKMKIYCFQEGYDENISDNDAWKLVLYTCAPSNAVLTVVNGSETIGNNRNRYKNTMTHISDGAKIYRAIIVRTSNEVSMLLDLLEAIKNVCLMLSFPLNINVNRENTLLPPEFDALYEPVETFAPQNDPIENNLEELENRVRNEAANMIYLINALANAKETLRQRKVALKYSMQPSL